MAVTQTAFMLSPLVGGCDIAAHVNHMIMSSKDLHDIHTLIYFCAHKHLNKFYL
jgi:hypothetical protein